MKLFKCDISSIKARQWFYWGSIVAVTLAHVLIYVVFPYSCDDYWYMSSIADYCKGIDRSFPAGDLWACWVDHYSNDNIRLSNIMFTLSLLLPKFVPSVLSGLLVGAMVWQSGKLAGITWRNPLLLTIMIVLIMFLLPWYEEMLTQCFAFNYIWASALVLMMSLLFWRDDRQLSVVVSLLLGVVVGAWHEGFAAPLLLGFMVYCVMSRHSITKSRVAMMAGLFLGLLWLASAPGLQVNVGYKTAQLTFGAVTSKLLYHLPMLLMIVSVVVVMMRRATRGILRNPMLVAIMVIGISGSALNFITNIGVRTGWVGYLYCIIATINIWHTIKGGKYVAIRSAAKKVAVVMLSAFLLSHYILVVYYAYKISGENDYVLEQYQKSSDGVVFADVTYDYEASPLAWKKPYFEIFTYTWVTYWIDRYYEQGKRLRVIPCCLQNASMLGGNKVPGDNPFRVYDGHLYATIRDGDRCNEEDYYDVDFGITKKRLKFSNFSFVDSNGGSYYFAFPQRAALHLWIGEIKSINKVR